MSKKSHQRRRRHSFGSHPHHHRQQPHKHRHSTGSRPHALSKIQHVPAHSSTLSKHSTATPKSSSQTTTVTSTLDAHTPFTSRKRALETVHFVFPRSNGEIIPYHFGKGSVDRAPAEEQALELSLLKDAGVADGSVTDDCKIRRPANESLEEILYQNRRKNERSDIILSSNPVDEYSKRDDRPRHVTDTSDSSEEEETITTLAGHLSGMSVEQAVRDKAGCRPRANSTDHELKLPQRGLCDERTVQKHYQWETDFLGSAKPKGLHNLGNTCFLNSTLQCLAYLPPFCQTVMAMNENHTNSKSILGKKITAILAVLFRQLHGKMDNGVSTAVYPRAIVGAVPSLGSTGLGRGSGYKFRPGRQEDAHEFLVHLLDTMHDGELLEAGIKPNKSGWRDRLPIPRLDETTFIHRIFGGYLRSQVKCTSCGYCSNTYDPCLDLSLEVSHRSCQSVATALQEFTRKETLDSQNKWKCSGCKKRVCAQKQLTVFRPPLSLCIQLKRFTFSGMSIGKKITKPIQFNAQMRLPMSDGRSCPYALSGIVIHVGGSASSGHYTAYIKKGQRWYHLDDSYAESVSEQAVLQQRDAYLLFYSRQEVKLEFPKPPIKSMSSEQARELCRVRELARAEMKASVPVTSPLENGSKLGDDERDEHSSDDVDRASKTSEETEKQNKVMGLSNRAGSGPDESRLQSINSKHAAPSTTIVGELTSPSLCETKNPVSDQEILNSSFDNQNDATKDVSPPMPRNDEGRNSVRFGWPSIPTSSACESTDSSSSGFNTQQDGNDWATIDTHDHNGRHNSNSGNDSIFTPKDRDVQTGDDTEKCGECKLQPDAEYSIPASRVDKQNEPKATERQVIVPKTRILLDRGAGRGKLEVMCGPRIKHKAWKPKAVTKDKSEALQLLGNVAVDPWGDETEPIEETPGKKVGSVRGELVKLMDKDESIRKRKMYLDRWDSFLDQGKKKKTKMKAAQSSRSSSTEENKFHRIQVSVQRMNRGRGKAIHLPKHHCSFRKRSGKERKTRIQHNSR